MYEVQKTDTKQIDKKSLNKKWMKKDLMYYIELDYISESTEKKSFINQGGKLDKVDI